MSLQLLNLLVALLYQVKIPTWFLSDFFSPLSQSSSFNQTQRPGDIVSSKSTNPREGDSDCAVFRSIFFSSVCSILSHSASGGVLYICHFDSSTFSCSSQNRFFKFLFCIHIYLLYLWLGFS